MPALITTTIPPQSFEVVRDRIAAILAVEMQNQIDLLNELTVVKVFTERYAKVDATECPCIIVSLERGDYANQDPTVVQGNYVFNIDLFVKANTKFNANSEVVIRADEAGIKALDTWLGWVRSIIQNGHYYRLQLPAGFIASRQILSVQNATPKEEQDVNAVVMGRATLAVSMAEHNGAVEALPIGDYETQVKIDTSDVGYVFTKKP